MKHSNYAAEFLAFMAKELGAAPDDIAPGKTRRFSTNGRPTDKAGACLMFDDGLGGICTDFRRGLTLVWSAFNRTDMTADEYARHAKRVEIARWEREMRHIDQQLRSARSITKYREKLIPPEEGSPVHLYFARRGLTGPLPGCLWLDPSMEYFGDHLEGIFPGMVAPLFAPNGKVVALHRTYLTDKGEKAPVATPKKLTPKIGSLDGACIPLHDSQDGILGIGEGIETSQAAHLLFGVPTVAAYCADNLSKFVWPPGLRQLFIFADHDEAGLRAARTLEQRAQRAGLKSIVMTPSVPGEDWCDVLQRTPKLGKEARQ